MARAVEAARVVAVSMLLHDVNGRVLLVQRGRGANVGLWSLPGGRVEAGETLAAAAERELAEETGLAVSAGAQVAVHEVTTATDGAVVTYEIHVLVGDVVAGELAAGDDAAAARWCGADELVELPVTAGLRELLAAQSPLP